jgi:nucleoside-diphosphate-sugar epimerase
MRGARVLVIGGSGFIGSHLCSHLKSKKIEYLAVDNFSNSNPDRYRLLTQDLNDINLVNEDSEKFLNETNDRDFSHVIDLAYINGTRQFYSRGCEILEGSIKSCKASVDYAESINAHYIYAGTPESYGYPNVFPTPESSELSIPDVSNPRWSYAIGKIACENYIHCKSHANNWTKFTIFRPFNAYGPLDKGHAIPELIEKLVSSQLDFEVLGSPTDTRSFCYIDDMVRMIEGLMNAIPEGKTYNIGNPLEVSMSELIEKLMDIFEIKKTVIWSTSLRGNPVRRVPNVSKLHRLFNQPLTTLETGLKHIKNSII